MIRERHITVPRTARYYTLGEPGARTTEVWFALHGYGQLAAAFLSALEPLDDGSRLIVAPEALSRFYLGGVGSRAAAERAVGAAWMTREDRLAEIDDQVRYLDAVTRRCSPASRPITPRVCVLGFSQGTTAAARWLALGTARVERLILWGGELPPDLDLSAQARAVGAGRSHARRRHAGRLHHRPRSSSVSAGGSKRPRSRSGWCHSPAGMRSTLRCCGRWRACASKLAARPLPVNGLSAAA